MSRRGLSLMEVVLGASLLALVFLFMLNIFPATMIGVRKAEHRLDAASLAESILEAARAAPFTDLVPGSYDADTPGALPLSRYTCEDQTVLEPHLSIDTVPGIPADQLVRLRLTITWKDRSGPQTLTQELRLADLKR